MKTKIVILGLVVLSVFLFFGCTQNENINYQDESDNQLLDEFDQIWEEDTTQNIDEMISTQDLIEIETENEILNETETIFIGEII